MPASALLGLGSRLYYSTDGVSYTELVDMEMIGPPGQPKRRKVELKLVDPADDIVQYLVGLREGGEFTASQHYTGTRFETMDALEGDTLYWRVRLPDSAVEANTSRVDFQGNLEEVSLSELSGETPITIKYTVQVITKPTFTIAV